MFFEKRKEKMTLEDFKAKDQPPTWSIVSVSSYSYLSPYANQIGLLSPESHYASRWRENESLPWEEYLLNLKPCYRSYGPDMGIKSYHQLPVLLSQASRDMDPIDEGEVIKLPAPEPVKAPLSSVLYSRRSDRNCEGAPMKLVDLSTILYFSCGVSGALSLSLPKSLSSSHYRERDKVQLRCNPSGGALYPISLYFIAVNVEDLERSLYYYSPYHHLLRKRCPVSVEKAKSIIPPGAYEGSLEKTSIIFLYAYNVWENVRKYGGMGISLAFIEIGQISQNLNLISRAVGYKTLTPPFCA